MGLIFSSVNKSRRAPVPAWLSLSVLTGWTAGLKEWHPPEAALSGQGGAHTLSNPPPCPSRG